MLSIFTKPIATITANDVAELVTTVWPEGYTVEFKRSLPNKKGGDDGWVTGAGQIGEYARDEILAEVIAFANAQGGNLVLGIDETKDKPPRASAIVPLPRVGDLARRFEDAGRACIDPPLPRLQVHAVETDPGTGNGVVLFRIGSSRNAPHRLTTTRECYTRHGSSTQRMTMREIQDMALNVARGTAGIDRAFTERRNVFQRWTEKFQPRAAVRATAIPLEQLPDPGRIPDNPGLFPLFRTFDITVGGRRTAAGLFVQSTSDRPIIRGVARYADTSSGNLRAELHQSGLIDIWLACAPSEHHREGYHGQFLWHHSHVLGAALQAMWSTAIFRHGVGVPDAEYALEIEMHAVGAGSKPILIGLFDNNFGLERYEVSGNALVFPRIPFRDETSFEAAVNTVDLDVFDALGVKRPARLPLSVRF